MLTQTVTVQNKLGLHARPSALLAKTAALFQCSIILQHKGQSVDAKSILGLMTMAAPFGTELIITTRGEDEKVALETIIRLFQHRFGEEE